MRFLILGHYNAERKTLKSTKCGVEMFAPEHYEEIRKHVSEFALTLKLPRKISEAGKRPAIYLPEDMVRAVGLKPRDGVDIYLQGKKRILIELTNTT